MTGTSARQPFPGRSPRDDDPAQDHVRYLLNLKPSGEDLTAEDLIMLARLDDGPLCADEDDDPYGAGFAPDTCPPEGWDQLPAAERQQLLYGDPAQPSGPEVLDAGFTHRYGGQGLAFAAGGPLDQMEPGATLTAFTDRAWEGGLGKLPDGELIGLMVAARRGASRQAALELATVSELAARRSGPGGRPGEHVEEEVAAALTLTGRAAGLRVAVAEGLARLPGVGRALAAGRIDGDKAEVFTGQLMLLDVIAANAIAGIVLPGAPGKTTGEIRADLVREIMDYDPAAVVRRRKEAEKDARVETWTEAAGTGAVAGRDLPPADVLAADKTLTADARWLKAHRVDGTMDQLRAKAFTARLTGQPLDSLLPPAGTGSAHAPTPHRAPAADSPAASGWAAGAGSSVNLTMPAAAWLGQSDSPGQISGLGAADAGTCRDLAGTLTRSPAAQWCVTLLGRDGRAVAHGCARAGPGPPGTGRRAWLATVTITPVETGTCTHRRESAGYQPSDSLRHTIKIRSPRCGFPGCRRPAARCDDDHTIPFDKGGRTCECNLMGIWQATALAPPGRCSA